jgi:hypothetical protein
MPTGAQAFAAGGRREGQMDSSSSGNIKPERDWIEDRIERLKALRILVGDELALRAIEELIQEAEERLRKQSD